MSFLLDTGILLRLVDKKDPRHALVGEALARLGDAGALLCIATQNAAEFCNVATRPVTNNGLGISPSQAL